jgi:hypothetical protein
VPFGERQAAKPCQLQTHKTKAACERACDLIRLRPHGVGAEQGIAQHRRGCRRCEGACSISIGYPGVALFNSTRALFNSTRVPTRVCGPYRSKNTALGVFRTPGGVLGTCFAL